MGLSRDKAPELGKGRAEPGRVDPPTDGWREQVGGGGGYGWMKDDGIEKRVLWRRTARWESGGGVGTVELPVQMRTCPL